MAKKSFTEIKNELLSGNFKPLYFFHGEEAFFIDQLIEIIEKNALPEEQKAFNQQVIYGGDVAKNPGAVIDAAMRLPMMAEKQVVIVKEAQRISQWDVFESYLKQINPSTILAIAHKEKKIDGRTGFAKALNKNAIVLEAKKVRDYEVANFVKQLCAAHQLQIDEKSTQLLVESIGNNLSRLSNEIDKLAIVTPDKKVDANIIEEHIGISKDYNVFELQNAFLAKDLPKAYGILNYFGKNPKAAHIVFILATLYSMFSRLLSIARVPHLDDREMASAVGVNPYFLKDYKVAIRHYSLPAIRRNLHLLAEYDLKAKGVNSTGNTTDKELLRELAYKMLS